MAVKIVECPRDAMQGFHHPISTDQKIEYLNALIRVGFNALDCGSFVSKRAVPQLADTKDVLNNIDLSLKNSSFITIVANERGADEACQFDQVDVLGFPFSISETFQLRNTNQTIKQASSRLAHIRDIAEQGKKELLVYLSMGFGNPYKDKWSTDIAIDWCKRLADQGITSINLSDTIGAAKAEDIKAIFSACIEAMPHIEFGAHLHTRADNYLKNISSAYEGGCRKFDSAIQGFGGCPFAADDLTGNLPTESLLNYLKDIKESTRVNQEAFDKAFALASKVFV
ncbi:MAG: hydroxymethylglutaryl-CoA lyase [Bacteroidia bacterium]